MDFYESIKQGLEEALEYQQEKINACKIKPVDTINGCLTDQISPLQEPQQGSQNDRDNVI